MEAWIDTTWLSQNVMVFSFHSHILLGIFNTWILMLYTFGIVKWRKGKFMTIVCPNDFGSSFMLVLSHITMFWTCIATLDFVFICMVHVNLLNPFTIVKKYLWSWMEGADVGPQMSKCKRANLETTWDKLTLCDSFCNDKCHIKIYWHW